MELFEIKRLVYGGEGDTVEFKRKVAHPEKVVREVVAFANSNGGHLLVGVNDDGSIPGVKFAEEEDYVLRKAIKELCRPSIHYESEIIPLKDDRAILHYHIHPSDSKPHYAFLRSHHRRGRAYVRVKDRSIQASKEVRQVLKSGRPNTGFSYGDKEKQLFNFLGENEKITLKQFAELSQISEHEASQIVVKLAMNNTIRIIPREKEDWYVSTE